VKRGASFFIRGLGFVFCALTCMKIELMSGGGYGTNRVSDFDPMDSCFGEGSFYYFFGIHGLRLIKNLTPLRVSPMRKRVRALKSKIAMLCFTTKASL
jgi:hypothetical protein